jgi:hypothetical protein
LYIPPAPMFLRTDKLDSLFSAEALTLSEAFQRPGRTYRLKVVALENESLALANSAPQLSLPNHGIGP